MKTGEPRGYVLTFRCINCGKHEVFANHPTEHITPEDRIRHRIYQVTCNSCGDDASLVVETQEKK